MLTEESSLKREQCSVSWLPGHTQASIRHDAKTTGRGSFPETEDIALSTRYEPHGSKGGTQKAMKERDKEQRTWLWLSKTPTKAPYRVGIAADLHAPQLEPVPVGIQLRGPAQEQVTPINNRQAWQRQKKACSELEPPGIPAE